MGSFNIHCQYSGLSIGFNVHLVILPIIHDKVYNKWFPYCNPVFAQYDDYGCVHSIENSKSNDIFKKVNKISITDFLSQLNLCDSESNKKILFKSRKIKYFIFLKSVWNELTKIGNVDYYQEYGNKEFLIHNGFKQINNLKDLNDSDKALYTKNNFNNQTFCFDKFNLVFKKGNVIIHSNGSSIYESDYKSNLLKETEFDLLHIYDLKKRYKKLNSVFNTSTPHHVEFDYQDDALKIFKELLKNETDDKIKSLINDVVKRHKKIKKSLYQLLIENDETYQLVADLSKVIYCMKTLHKEFIPYQDCLGFQHGDTKKENEIYSKILEISNVKIQKEIDE